MREIDFHEFTDSLTATFRRYLYTTNLVADSEPGLRQAIFEELSRPDVFARQPLVTCIPAYRFSLTPAELMRRKKAPCLEPSLGRFSRQEFDPARQLYEHQVTALQKAQEERNLIVATGTGSGKTECFLLPALDDAARHPGDGVRAIIVYPMNALANDQLNRLRRLLAPIPEITFGRYTGDTPWTREKLSEEEAKRIAPNERYSREEIRQNPPHILLTNFAMLEYLLLRPGDADIFRQQRLRYVVLDEAHTYTGAQGIDVALLMRRLQEAFRNAPLQFILTSATLTEGQSEEARARIAGFGSQLTGTKFEPEDVIFGATTTSIAENGNDVTARQIISAVPDEPSLLKWLEALDDGARLRELITQSNLPNNDASAGQRDVAAMLYHLLRDWQPLRRIHEAISARPRDFSELTKMLWGEETADNQRALQWLMLMAAYGRAHVESSPLLPVRFHYFFRGLNGATICLDPGCAERHPQATRWSRVFLEDRMRCEELCGKLVWPLLTCFQCGMPAVAAWVSGGEQKLSALRPSSEENCARLALTWDEAVAESGEEEEATDDRDVDVCLSCGEFKDGGRLAGCCSAATVVTLRRLATKEAGELKQCPRCGATARPFDSVLRDFRSGEDATTAVLAEAMMRKLPPESRDADKLPAGGRRMLAFSDSRQRAAFFAPYLKRTTGETEYLKPLYDALLTEERANDEEPVTLEDIAKRFVRQAQKCDLVWLRTPDNDDQDVIRYEYKLTRDLLPADINLLRRQAYITLLRHFCASPRQRLNLPGLGLAATEIALSKGNREDIPAMLPDVFAGGHGTGFDFLQQLLQIFLMRVALNFEYDSISLRDIREGPQLATFHRSFNDQIDGRQRYRWNPYAANKPRQRTIETSFTAGLVANFFRLDLQGDRQKVDEYLNSIWDCLRRTALRDIHPGEYQVDSGRLVVTTKRNWYRCDRCGRLSVFNVKGMCAAPRCNGQMQAFSTAEMESRFSEHHYRRRLTELAPLALNVAEHTAQLTNKRGAEHQKDFMAGKINVLSSSTTFEMGVDVGALKAVMLRNVPPAASNYIQRAGRAGRRREGAAYAVTYCRNMPHDQHHFHRSPDIVDGKIALPLINLQNRRLAQRHINSFLLGQFLRARQGDGEGLTVAEFFLNPTAEESPAARFESFIESEARRLREAIERILPPESELETDHCLTEAYKTLFSTDPDCVYEREVRAPLESYQRELGELRIQQQTATDGRQLTAIGRAQTSVDKLIVQLKEERLIDFLAGCNWLPGYAFPQDVVRLLVRQDKWSDRMRLERDRESGISEYAPGSEIIADGHLFKSAGVIKHGQAFVVKQYKYCPNCRQLKIALEHEDLGKVCLCPNPGHLGMKRKYIEPKGFQTLIDERVPEPNLYRLRPPSNTELFLVAGAPPGAFLPYKQLKGVSYGYCREGKLFRANPGHRYERFRLCIECGRYFARQPAQNHHQTPWGTKCFGSIFQTDLAHEFTTDTLQIRFDQNTLNPPLISDQVFWLSLQTAFTSAAAETLAIPRSDLDGAYRSQKSDSLEGELVIYDRVPGGAGYVERIIESLPAILLRTLEKTRDCDNPLCDLNGSCYACLRSYANQFRWDLLSRREVCEWLATFVNPLLITT
jgi:superfamily II DNA/RNA helicase